MTGSRFAKLLDFARANDSAQRRELLREVTDLFFESRPTRTESEAALFGDVLQMVAAEMQDNVLAELANRFAGEADAPVGLMRDLANHAFEVAAPVLRNSSVLQDTMLIEVVRYQSQAHITAVAERKIVSEALSDAIVACGDDSAIGVLVRNEGARLSRGGMEQVVDRARANAALHESVVRRKDLPLDLLNEMYFFVEKRLREEILNRNAQVDPIALDEALSRARERLRQDTSASSEDHRRAESFIRRKRQLGELKPELLVSLHRNGLRLHFLHGLADMTDLDVDTASDVIERRDFDALAMICRAANIERTLFVTLAMLMCDGEDAMKRASEFGALYNSVPVESAQRAMRFFKVRRAATDDTAQAAAN